MLPYLCLHTDPLMQFVMFMFMLVEHVPGIVQHGDHLLHLGLALVHHLLSLLLLHQQNNIDI